MREGYEKLEFHWGSLDDAIAALMTYKEIGAKKFIDFNGYELYSDDITVDSAYVTVTGMTKQENEEYLKERQERYEKEELEHKESIPSKILEFNKKAIGVIKDDRLDYWNEIVPIRLNDLYRGMELGCTLEIAEIIADGDISFPKAKEVLNNQGHSGTSYGLMKAMIKTFCINGDEFVEYLCR